jgi:hypothetical protein
MLHFFSDEFQEVRTMKKHFNLLTLSEREQKSVKGGFCACGCAWANCGGSSTGGNFGANYTDNKKSPDFEPQDRG